MNYDFVWTPPGLDEESATDFLSLTEGIPSAANEAIYRWITDSKYPADLISVDFLVDFQTALRKDLGILNRRHALVAETTSYLRTLDQTTLAYLLDFILSRDSASYAKPKAQSLSKILGSAGAGWTVGLRGERYGLIEALPSGVIQSVEHVTSLNSQAGALLRNAWDAAFGINKKPSHAYYDAVRSVEVLSTPLISPNDSDATLGKDINVLRNSSHKWSFALEGSSKIASPVEHVLSMMQLLWHSHNDRHGHEDYEDVSVEQAQAAVLLASTLVGWLSQEMLKRLDR